MASYVPISNMSVKVLILSALVFAYLWTGQKIVRRGRICSRCTVITIWAFHPPLRASAHESQTKPSSRPRPKRASIESSRLQTLTSTAHRAAMPRQGADRRPGETGGTAMVLVCFFILHTAALRPWHIYRQFTASRPSPADETSAQSPP
jgi:ribosomal protein S27AE